MEKSGKGAGKSYQQEQSDINRIREEFMLAHLTDDSESDDELPVVFREIITDSELPPQYWLLLKVVKYIKVSPNVTDRQADR